MAVDKVLEIDLTKLTPASLKRIDDQIGNIIDVLENTDKRAPVGKFQDPLLIPKTQKEEGLRKIFGRQTFGNLLKFGSNPQSFLTSGVTKLIPFIGTALAATGVIFAIIQRIDTFEKEFVDRVDDRISLARTKEQQALVQAGLQQIIITSASGSTEPRDAYNTFREFNENQQRIETDFQIRSTDGVE